MSKKKTTYTAQVSELSLANAIVRKLDERKTFRTKLPSHIDRAKFLHLVKKDVREVLAAMKLFLIAIILLGICGCGTWNFGPSVPVIRGGELRACQRDTRCSLSWGHEGECKPWAACKRNPGCLFREGHRRQCKSL